MAGLPSNNNGKIIKQWYQLYTQYHSKQSEEAYAHWQEVKRLGLPNLKDEDWKYTNIKELFSYSFVPAIKRIVTKKESNALNVMLDVYRLVFVDGYFISSLSDNYIGLWQIETKSKPINKSILKPIQSDVFLHLTECLSQQITYISLPAGKLESKPLYILHISQGSKNKKNLSTLNYRLHINIEAGAQGQVIEHFSSIDAQAHFSGARTTILIGDNTNFSHIKLILENYASYHFGHNDINIGYNAITKSNTFIFGSKLARHKTSIKLNGEGSNLYINSLFMPSRKNTNDHRIYLEHNKGHCLSKQLHKIIACEYSKGVFNGVIKVKKHAIKTDSKMISNNLLLDNLSEINTKPQLEIYTDDVKCCHGATVGSISDEQVFYLRSRGIDILKAKQMVISAFSMEVTEKICNTEISNIILTKIINILQKKVAL